MFVIYIEPAYGKEFKEEHETAVAVAGAIERLLHGPFAQINGIKGFKVVDTKDDCIVYIVEENKVIFPTKEDYDRLKN